MKSEEEWRHELDPESYRVLREKATERAFSGKNNDFKEQGMFTCGACDEPLFSSKTKYDSGSGWPSFYQPVDPANVTEIPDYSHGMLRTEVICSKCDSHLGHVFPDGPPETGLRYCINSVSLSFKNG